MAQPVKTRPAMQPFTWVPAHIPAALPLSQLPAEGDGRPRGSPCSWLQNNSWGETGSLMAHVSRGSLIAFPCSCGQANAIDGNNTGKGRETACHPTRCGPVDRKPFAETATAQTGHLNDPNLWSRSSRGDKGCEGSVRAQPSPWASASLCMHLPPRVPIFHDDLNLPLHSRVRDG